MNSTAAQCAQYCSASGTCQAFTFNTTSPSPASPCGIITTISPLLAATASPFFDEATLR